MRLIKFRAWDKRNKSMIQVGSIHWTDSLEIRHLGYLDPSEGITRIEHFQLMQHTGLHDKNGKEIYEGDILRRPDGTGTHLMEWKEHCDENGDVMAYGFEEWDTNNMEVIGNIYENPELIQHD